MNIKGVSATRAQILSVGIPKGTSTYKPVSHQELIDVTLEQADKVGFSLRKETYEAASFGNIVTGYFDFDVKGVTDDELGIRVAWQNSYNRKVTLKFAIGATVFVCTNGAFSGELGAFKRRHTGDVQTLVPANIVEYFQQAEPAYVQLVKDKQRLKEWQLDKSTIAELVGDLYLNEGLIQARQLAIIKKELEHPTFNYNADGTGWQLYNHITHALKTAYPSEQVPKHEQLHKYMMAHIL